MRKRKGHIYYYINSLGESAYTIDHYSKDDDKRFKIGNYFDEKGIREQLKEIRENSFLSWFSKLLNK